MHVTIIGSLTLWLVIHAAAHVAQDAAHRHPHGRQEVHLQDQDGEVERAKSRFLPGVYAADKRMPMLVTGTGGAAAVVMLMA
jgi:hypothetical protein